MTHAAVFSYLRRVHREKLTVEINVANVHFRRFFPLDVSTGELAGLSGEVEISVDANGGHTLTLDYDIT